MRTIITGWRWRLVLALARLTLRAAALLPEGLDTSPARDLASHFAHWAETWRVPWSRVGLSDLNSEDP